MVKRFLRIPPFLAFPLHILAPTLPPVASLVSQTQTHLVNGHLGGDRHRLGSWQLSVQHTVEVVSRRPVHERTERACRVCIRVDRRR